MTADMLDVTTEPDPHVIYPGGPLCQPNCPGPWSMYHDGYADGYENAEAEYRRDLRWPAVALVAALTGFLVLLWATGRLG